MRAGIALGAAAVLLAIALAVMAPAALLDARIAALSDGRARIVNTAGTIWNGSGELVLLPAGPRQPLSWRLDAWPLLRGEVRGTIAVVEGAPNATLTYDRDRFELRGLDVSLPAESVLRAATGAKAPLGIGGALLVHVERLLQAPEALDAQLTLQWRNASVPGPRADIGIALGDVRLDLGGRGIEVSGPIGNTGGDVEIAGQLAVAAAGTAKLDATLRARGADRARTDTIAAALSAFGAPDGQGGYRVTWSGTWR